MGRLHAGGRQVGRPLAAALLDVDALQERRDHLAQFDEHHVGVLARLGQRVRAHAQQQLLVGLARPVQADVGEGGCGKHAAQRVERLGARRLAVHEVAVTGLLGELLGHPGLHAREERAVGVEDSVHLAHEAGAVLGVEQFGWPEVAVLPVVEPLVVRDVARRLLEVGHETSPLEDLRQHVGGLLAGEVDAAELCDRVVAVLDEDPLVELLGALQADRRVHRRVTGDVEVPDELLEEEPPQALGRAGVPCEEGAFDHFRQVDQGKHRLVQVGHVAAEDRLLVRGEALF